MDDIRDIPAHFNKDEWVILRSYDEAVAYVLSLKEKINFISFDHDLSYDHYLSIDPTLLKGLEKTGYDFAKWIVEYDMDHNILADDFNFYVHSMNPVGAENIKQFMFSYLKIKFDK